MSDERDFDALTQELWDTGWLCAEAVALAGAVMLGPRRLGIALEDVPRMATGFCSGMARCGGTCGAVSGTLLVLGLAHGRRVRHDHAPVPRPDRHLEPCYEPAQEFMDAFRAEFGSMDCSELLGLDLGTPEGQAAFKERGLKENQCWRYVAFAMRWLNGNLKGDG